MNNFKLYRLLHIVYIHVLGGKNESELFPFSPSPRLHCMNVVKFMIEMDKAKLITKYNDAMPL